MVATEIPAEYWQDRFLATKAVLIALSYGIRKSFDFLPKTASLKRRERLVRPHAPDA
jgi:hypothetical protein